MSNNQKLDDLKDYMDDFINKWEYNSIFMKFYNYDKYGIIIQTING